MDQTLINWLLAGFGSLIGFMLNMVWQAVKDLQCGDKELAREIASMKILVVGDYVKKTDLSEMVKALFAKLDSIEDKLDKKADK